MLSRRDLLMGAPLLWSIDALAEDHAAYLYAAMTFRPVLDEIIRTLAIGSITPVYGPTPALVRQIESGAPADILLTADPAWMDEASKKKLIQPETRIDLLGNDLVLAGSRPAPQTDLIGPDYGLAAVLGDGKLAMCAPDSDPAGRYAKQSLTSLGLWDTAAPHLAIVENSLAAVRMVERGEAPAAICFATDLHDAKTVTVLGRFPSASHAPIVYPMALTRQASRRAEAAFTLLRSAAVRHVFQSFGYKVL